VLIQLYPHDWELGKREIVWKHDARRAECFHTITSFPISTIRKNALYFLQRNIKKDIFRVDIDLYQHGY
jgi:hypothetical protein